MDATEIRFISCSSEDATNTGVGLCKATIESPARWLTAAPEKRASLEIELTQPGKIYGVDVGVYAAAFLEIKVSGKEKGLDNFVPLLGTMNCRSMKEVKEGANREKEFSLRQERFMRTVASSETTRIQFSLTQPYAPSEQIGLTHVRIYVSNDTMLPMAPSLAKPVTAQPQVVASTTSKDAGEAKKPARVLPPSFMTKPSKPLEFETGSMSTDSVEIVAPKVSKDAHQPVVSLVPKQQSPALPSPQKSVEKSQGAQQSQSSSNTTPSNTQQKHSSPQKPATAQADSKVNTKPQAAIPPQTQPQPASQGTSQSQGSTKTPYNSILQGVVIVVSGIGNPERADLRRIAKEMGADYRPDWAKDATHLVCEFFGTPKQKDASNAGGKIVKKSWIYECSKQGKRLSEHSFSFDYKKSPPKQIPQLQQTVKAPPPQTQPQTQTQQKQNSTQQQQTGAPTKISSLPPVVTGKTPQAPASTAKFIDNDKLDNTHPDDEDMDTLDRMALQEASSFVGKLSGERRSSTKRQVNYREDSDDESAPKTAAAKRAKSDDNDDDDDGWGQLISRGGSKAKSPVKKSLDDDDDDWGVAVIKKTPAANVVFSDTEEDSDDDAPANVVAPSTKKSVGTTPAAPAPQSSATPHADLPSFLSGCSVYFHKLDEEDRKQLFRSVVAYGGEVKTTLDDAVTHIITNRQWEESYTVVLQDNPDVRIVRPSWVQACIKASALLPAGSHAVQPK